MLNIKQVVGNVQREFFSSNYSASANGRLAGSFLALHIKENIVTQNFFYLICCFSSFLQWDWIKYIDEAYLHLTQGQMRVY